MKIANGKTWILALGPNILFSMIPFGLCFGVIWLSIDLSSRLSDSDIPDKQLELMITLVSIMSAMFSASVGAIPFIIKKINIDYFQHKEKGCVHVEKNTKLDKLGKLDKLDKLNKLPKNKKV